MSLAGIVKKTAICEIRAYLLTRSETDGSKSEIVPIEHREVIQVKFCPACGKRCEQSFLRESHPPRKKCCVVCTK